MKYSFMTRSGAFTEALLVDGFLNAHHRFSRTGKLEAGDAKWFEGALKFIKNAYQGFLRALSVKDVEDLNEQRPLISSKEFTTAFKLAIEVWVSDAWQNEYPDFSITRDSINQELKLYISAITQALESDTTPTSISGLSKTRTFFVELGKVALDTEVDDYLLPLGLEKLNKT